MWGRLPPGGRRKGWVEMYDWGRFFTCSGEIIDGHDKMADASLALSQIHRKLFGEANEEKAEASTYSEYIIDDEVLVGLARAQDNRFLMLWNGDWEGLYSTPSEATYALCRMLAYWTQRDVDRIDRIFRRSGLMREKWDESRAQSTWGRNTIINALRSPYIPSLVPRSDLEAQAHLPETDTGNRNRLVLRHGEDLRHCKQSDTWHIWDGMCWGEDITGAVVRAAIETAESMKDETNHMGDSDADARLRRYRFAMQAQNHGPLMNMISLAESALSVKISEFNRD